MSNVNHTSFSDSVSWHSVCLSTFFLKWTLYKDSAILSPSKTSPRVKALWRTCAIDKSTIKAIVQWCQNQQYSKSHTHLFGPADRERIIMVGFLGVMIRPHFIHVKHDRLAFLVSGCPGNLWKQAQKEQPTAHHPAKSHHHGPWVRENSFNSRKKPLKVAKFQTPFKTVFPTMVSMVRKEKSMRADTVSCCFFCLLCANAC